MSVSSAGDRDNRPLSQISTTGKVINNNSRTHVTDKYWTTVANSLRKSSTSAKPVSPNVQHIIDKHPVLNIYNSTSDYDKLFPPINEPHIEPMSTDTTLSQAVNNQSHTNISDTENISIANINSNLHAISNNKQLPLSTEQFIYLFIY